MNTNNSVMGSLATSKTVKDIQLPKWKKEHLSFITNIRGGDAAATGKNILKEFIYDSEYLKCDYCQRKFNQSKTNKIIYDVLEAFDRHYEACKTMKHRPKPPPSLSVSSQNYYNNRLDKNEEKTQFKLNILKISTE